MRVSIDFVVLVAALGVLGMAVGLAMGETRANAEAECPNGYAAGDDITHKDGTVGVITDCVVDRVVVSTAVFGTHTWGHQFVTEFEENR